MESSTGDGNAFQTWNGERFDSLRYGFSLVLTDGTKTSLDIVDVTGGSGVIVKLKNNGNTREDNFPVHFVVRGGILKKIALNLNFTVSEFNPGDTTSLLTGTFFGLGKITIFVVGDGIATYKHSIQLFMYTIIQE